MVNLRQINTEEPPRINSTLENRNTARTIAGDVRPRSAPANNLNSRINTVRNQLQLLRYQVEKERSLLEEDRRAMNNYNFSKVKDERQSDYSINSCGFKGVPVLPQDKTILTAPSKKHLKDIEHQCDLELVKLQNYLQNIGELKTHWRYLMTKNHLSEFMSSDEVNQGMGEFCDPQIGSKSENYFN